MMRRADGGRVLRRRRYVRRAPYSVGRTGTSADPRWHRFFTRFGRLRSKTGPVDSDTCRPPLSTSPHHPPFFPLPFSPLFSPPLPSAVGPNGCCTSPFFRPPHVYTAHTPHLSVGVVVRSLFTVCCAGKFMCKCASVQVCKFVSMMLSLESLMRWQVCVQVCCASVQVCPYDAFPSQIPEWVPP